jgi:hypothetical protein
MSEPAEPTIHHSSEGAIAAAHPERPGTVTAAVAPATEGQRNTFRLRLVPKACWKIEDLRFEFDSSFLLPEAAPEMRALHDLIEGHKRGDEKPPLSLFGHADPSGKDEYNKKLSGRRATAVYAALTRRADLWERLFSKPEGGDTWGLRHEQLMLAAVGHSPGSADGVSGKATTDAVKAFQGEQGLKADGVVGSKTREKLFLAYMDFLCGADFKLEKTDFLGRGVDGEGKADYQGCSEFNPLLLLSKEENSKLSKAGHKAERDRLNAPNRRVMAFLFFPGRVVVPDDWPCPRAAEDGKGCKARFFADGEQRRAPGDERREFAKTPDTFACRFYHRFATDSPCERPLPPGLGLGFLAVQLFFHQQPMEGIEVQFAQLQGTEVGPPIGEPVLTRSDGIATLARPVPLGNYVCQIEGQPAKMISSVEAADEPVVLVLPIGRPLRDFEGDVEFLPDTSE